MYLCLLVTVYCWFEILWQPEAHDGDTGPGSVRTGATPEACQIERQNLQQAVYSAAYTMGLICVLMMQ